MEEKREPKMIVEKIPEKMVSPIKTAIEKNKELDAKFKNLALQIADLESQQRETFDKLKSNATSITNKMKYAFDKMKLEKKHKDYSWRYDGKESFVGVEVIKKENK